MEKITVKNAQEGQVFQLQMGGKRLKTIEQSSENLTINGVKMACTRLVVNSALEALEIILPAVGFWKFGENKDCLIFITSGGTCAEFKIMFA